LTYDFKCDVCHREVQSPETQLLDNMCNEIDEGGYCEGRLRRIWTTAILRSNLRDH
jgi:hypothetical protein